MSDSPLSVFLPPVQRWFRETFGLPTPPQAEGWPPIQRGEHTLILAPTGSGKTLAAFLWGIDQIFRKLADDNAATGVHLLYISPLKALNNDVERNMRVPLEGVREVAARMGQPLPSIRVAVRTGDTPSHARAQMWKRPPQILITTPESLYLMLTSPRARAMFATVRTVIVDEIHTLVGDKRGAHLSLSLERLERLAAQPVQRIGLSATIKPLDEVARFLGGQQDTAEGFGARPVHIVNAGYRKPLELKVITAVDDFNAMPAGTIWPYVIPRVLHDIRQHRTTLIFTNNRRLAERTADRLNAQLAAEQSEEIEPGSSEALAPGGTPREGGIFAIGAEGPIRAHHGSMAKEKRRQLEEELKQGKLPALVGTSSLELGIDIGSVDLVVQLQSPKSVAQGLQRVGRSGHMVGQTSVGHIYPSFREDLLEAAAVARGMLDGDVEPSYTPQNPLDVLAQQIVAMVATEDWSVPDLYQLVRRAYAYRDLSPKAFTLVLEMLTGRYYDLGDTRAPSTLRAKIAWDRIHDRLSALPGSRLLAYGNAGTIADRGVYGVYLGDGKTKVGELDEEFVYETRAGNTFLLGSQVWRVLDIQHDRVIVGDAAGEVPRMPFWHGDYPWRSYELGVRVGAFRRELAERIRANAGKLDAVVAWLRDDYKLDENSAQNLIAHINGQLEVAGVISSERTIVVESFQDATGECNWAIHSPFGGRVNGAWALALSGALREVTGVNVESQVGDDGILFRFPQTGREPPVDIVRRLGAAEARERILHELPDSALFGAHFRMNAARALLLPRSLGRKRTPFWLQRLKAKDLLAVVRQFDDFPIVAETYRDCLRDVLDLPHLEEVLGRIERGEISVVPIETLVPSPIAAGLLLVFQTMYMYEWDAPKAEKQLTALALRRDVLDDLLGAGGTQLSDLLKPEAIDEVAARAQHVEAGYQARTREELALQLFELGDLSAEELVARSSGDAQQWIAELAQQGRAVERLIPTAHGSETRWVHAERADEYRDAFDAADAETALAILRRFFRNSGPLTRAEILDRYAFEDAWLAAALAQLVESREVLRGHFTAGVADEEFCERHNLEQIHQRTLTLLRREVQPVAPQAYADFLTRWQHLHPQSQLAGTAGLRALMQQLRGVLLPGSVWERDVLPARLSDYETGDLDALVQSGDLIWVAAGNDARRSRVRFFLRGEGALFLDDTPPESRGASAQAVYDFLKSEGASFTADIEAGTALKPSAVKDALVELALAGVVTNDTLSALRALLQHEPHMVRAAPSALESELVARKSGPRHLRHTRYQSARRLARARLQPEAQAQTWQGRWSLVQRATVMGRPLAPDERADKLARLLLARYGVLSRERLEREALAVDWSLLYPHLQRMEMRGEARRGYFIAGLMGAQFALPDAVEQLRAVAASGDDALVVLNATDPALIHNSEVASERSLQWNRVPSSHVVQWRGRALLVAEDSGKRISTLREAEPALIERALHAYLARPNAPHHIVINSWNDEPLLGSAGEPLLQQLGFDRTPSGMERWSRFGAAAAE